ncbi:MAG: hypothetical protein AABX13_03265 [Nanoarchaeota archaeon]
MTTTYLFRAVNVFDWEEMQLDGLVYDTYDSEREKYSLTVYPSLNYALRCGRDEGAFHRLLAIPVEKYLPGGLAQVTLLGAALADDAAFDLEQAVQIDDVIVPDSLNSLITVCPTITQEELNLFYRECRK